MRSIDVPSIAAGQGFKAIRDFALCPIAQFPWAKNEFRPQNEARVAYEPGVALYVQLASDEGAYQALRADCRHANGDVYLDSCLEFFADFAPEQDEGYLNFEFNPLGVLHLKLGKSRSDRRPIQPERFSIFQIKADQDLDPLDEVELGWWRIRFIIPETFLRSLYGEAASLVHGHVFRGNFYKCGDATEFEHYALWSETKAEQPDFHRPEFFGRLRLS